MITANLNEWIVIERKAIALLVNEKYANKFRYKNMYLNLPIAFVLAFNDFFTNADCI